jgi:hypothetical protein
MIDGADQAEQQPVEGLPSWSATDLAAITCEPFGRSFLEGSHNLIDPRGDEAEVHVLHRSENVHARAWRCSG